MFRRKFIGFVVLYTFLFQSVALAKVPSGEIYQAPQDVIEKIKKEGMGENSQVMKTMSYLSDVIGGRLTGSPNMKQANEWTRDTMAKWGLQNAKLEAWGPFGRGWTLNEFSASVIAPKGFPLIAYPQAWSPATNGTVRGKVVWVNVKTEQDLDQYKGKLENAIVLMSGPRVIKAGVEGLSKRFTDTQLLDMANAPDPARHPQADFTQAQVDQFLAGQALIAKTLKMLIEEKAAVLVFNSPGGSGGTVYVQGASVATDPPKSIGDIFGGKGNSPWDKAAESKMLPQIIVASEDYNRVLRMVELGQNVEMSVNIDAQYNDDDQMAYNTVAEIPGTDPKLKDEVVMLGGHLDSWHSSGGATDNGAGCAVAMEAVRILMATGLKPRRTIRVGLWSGEEQGIYGSEAYVSQHFGSRKNGDFFSRLSGLPQGPLNKKDEYDKFSAYYNMDNGTGKFRGVYLQGNSEVAPIFRVWLEPFAKMGASTLTMRNTGGTDHLSFDAIGLPGFQFIQDPIEYNTLTHHSNQDNYDRIQDEDMKQNATIMAAFVYQTAMMDGKIPRKTMVERDQ